MAGNGGAPIDASAVARGYLRCSDALSRDDDPDAIWSPETNPDERDYEFVDEVIRNGPPEVAWALVRSILEQSVDEQLAFHAAGPLENLVRRWGTQLVPDIEALAIGDERFQWALGRIWLRRSDLPADVLQRIVNASGGGINPI